MVDSHEAVQSRLISLFASARFAFSVYSPEPISVSSIWTLILSLIYSLIASWTFFTCSESGFARLKHALVTLIVTGSLSLAKAVPAKQLVAIAAAIDTAKSFLFIISVLLNNVWFYLVFIWFHPHNKYLWKMPFTYWLCQPFTEPTVSPFTKYFWKNG